MRYNQGVMEIRQTEVYFGSTAYVTGKHERASMHVYVACPWVTLET